MRARPKRGSRTGVALGLALVSVALGAAAALVFFSEDSPPGRTADSVPVSTATEPATQTGAATAKGAAAAFLDAWLTRDWEALDSIVTSRGDNASAEHAAWFNDLAVTTLELDLLFVNEEDGNTVASYEVAVGVSDAGVWRYFSEVELVERPAGWLVNWQPAALHPALDPGDHLAVSPNWPERALITDLAGRPLVAEQLVVTIGVVPNRVESRVDLAAALELHLGVAPEEVDRILDAPGVQPDWFLPVRTVDRISYVELRPELYPVPGVVFRIAAKRAPAADPVADLVGTTGPATAELLATLGPAYDASSQVGRSGLERAFERDLAGSPGYAILRRRPGEPDELIHSLPAAAGTELRTALRLEAQIAAETVLDEAEFPAALVAIDTATGEIRAAVAKPAGGFNEALSGLYPPGSTFKIVVATALLESGMTPGDSVDCPEVVTVSGREFRNAARLPRSLTLEQAFARSCNTAFIELGTGLDPAVLAGLAERYGFGSVPDIGLDAASGDYTPADDPVERAAAMIGQGKVLTSPLLMASVAATAATGRRYAPTLIPAEETRATTVFDEAVTAGLRRMMDAVVAGGTGSAAAMEDLPVAGKTGSAQVGEGEAGGIVAWFAGYSGDLAFAVVVDGSNRDADISGGSTAAPLARRFLEELANPSVSGSATAECLPEGADWPTFQGGGTRSGCSQALAPRVPEVVWRADTGIQAWLNSPVVAGDTVLVGSAGSRRAAPDDGDGVYALRLSDGAVRWRFATANDVNGVAVDDGLVVAVGDEGSVWGFELSSGKELWRLDTGSPVFGYPVFTEGAVVVGDADGRLNAITRDGAVAWEVQLEGAIRGGPASAGGIIYAVSEFGDMRAVNSDGFVIWSGRTEISAKHGDFPIIVYGSPTIVGDRLIVTFTVEGGPGGPGVLAYDRYLGTLLWEGSDPSGVGKDGWANVRPSVAAVGDVLILASSLSRGPQAIELDTGRAVWIGGSGISCERQWASPVVMGDVVVLPRPDGAVYGYAVDDGTFLWRLVTTFGGEAPTLGCTEPGGRVSDGAPLHASVAIAPDGKIIVASTGRGIFALDSP